MLRNVIVGNNGYNLLILRKIMFSIYIGRLEIQNLRFFFLSVYFVLFSFKYICIESVFQRKFIYVLLLCV